MSINDKVFALFLPEGLNLDEARKIFTENIARNKGYKNRIDTAILEQTLRRFAVKESQTANNLFNQNQNSGYNLTGIVEDKIEEGEEVTYRREVDQDSKGDVSDAAQVITN